MNRKIGECEKCGEKADFWRCKEHYCCDDCGTRENLCMRNGGVICDSCHEKRVEKRIAEFGADTDYTAEIVCPWCGYEHSDSWEKEPGNRNCPDCGRDFEVERNVEVTYSTSRI